jgi:oxygen-independent coproporphyrinogen-3 oxidase
MIPILAQAADADAQAPVQDLTALMRPGTLQLQGLPPLSLYVHIPWCLRKCPYCDFNSHAHAPGTLPQAAYTQALLADLEAALPLIWGRVVHSVFIGGGTPSLFDPSTIATLIGDIRARLRLAPDCEITMEANPGTFEKERFRDFAGAGVTRLSIGVQSFNDRHLQALGRVHDRAQSLAAVEEAAQAFATFNLDLMYALPGQTLDELQADLSTALAFAPPHLSVYQLTLEPNTYFATHPPVLPDDDTAYDMLDHISAAAQAAGLERYEVSAYARPGHACWHNRNYWEFGDYLGVGAGAHSKLSFPHRVIRQVRARDPALYMQRAQAGGGSATVTQSREVSRADLPFEFMLNALRLKDGVKLAQFRERTGLPLSTIESKIAVAKLRGLLECDHVEMRPTSLGFDFLSNLQSIFLP